MYFHSVHGKNIQLTSDSSEAKRTSGFCQGITFSNNPMIQFERVTFQVGYQPQQFSQLGSNHILINSKSFFKRSNKKNLWSGNLVNI